MIPFAVEGVPHELVAAALGFEHGIEVRSGCFCAHPYVVHLLGIGARERSAWQARALAGDRSRMPGLVRVSFGVYNDHDDVERLAEALARVARGDIGRYRLDPASGAWWPRGHRDRFDAALAELFGPDAVV